MSFQVALGLEANCLTGYLKNISRNVAEKFLLTIKENDMSAYDSNNIFAKILRGEIPNHTVYEDEKVLAFLRIEDRLTDQNMADVSLFEVGEYGALKSRPGRDGMEMDHIPSKAALCEATYRYIEESIKRELNGARKET